MAKVVGAVRTARRPGTRAKLLAGLRRVHREVRKRLKDGKESLALYVPLQEGLVELMLSGNPGLSCEVFELLLEEHRKVVRFREVYWAVAPGDPEILLDRVYENAVKEGRWRLAVRIAEELKGPEWEVRLLEARYRCGDVGQAYALLRALRSVYRNDVETLARVEEFARRSRLGEYRWEWEVPAGERTEDGFDGGGGEDAGPFGGDGAAVA